MSASTEACLGGMSEEGSGCVAPCVHMCEGRALGELVIGWVRGELCERQVVCETMCVWKDLGLMMVGQLGADMEVEGASVGCVPSMCV